MNAKSSIMFGCAGFTAPESRATLSLYWWQVLTLFLFLLVNSSLDFFSLLCGSRLNWTTLVGYKATVNNDLHILQGSRRSWWTHAPPLCYLKAAAVPSCRKLTHASVWFPIICPSFFYFAEIHQPTIQLICIFIHLFNHWFLQTKVSKTNWITPIPKCIWIDSMSCRKRLSNIPL